MQRFYFPDLEQNTNHVLVKNKHFINQLIKVLRVTQGFQLILFSGKDDLDQIYEISEIEKKEISLKRIGELQNNSELNFDINIVQAFPNKFEKMEYIVQKGTEVGVTGFYFFRSERSQKLNLSENKIERLHRIIIEASEQSGRSVLPELVIEDSLSLEACKQNDNIILHHIGENDAQKLKKLKIDYQKGVNIFVGPEGGFSENEIKIFDEYECKKVYLGDRILRTETAGVVTSFFVIQNY